MPNPDFSSRRPTVRAAKPEARSTRPGLRPTLMALLLVLGPLLAADVARADSLSVVNTIPLRQEPSAVWDGTRFLVFGGVSSTYLSDIQSYDPVANLVTQKAATLPTGRACTSAVWDGTNVYIFGGHGTSGHSNQIVRYNPATDTRTVMSAVLPTARTCTSAVWDGTKALIFGGSSATGYLRDILAYNPTTDTVVNTLALLPTARMKAPAAWDGSNAYVFGGYQGPGSYTNQIVRYSPLTNQVTVLPTTLPSNRQNMAAAGDAAGIYIFGGYDGAFLSSILRYVPSTGVLTTMPATLPAGREAMAAAFDGSNAYVFGGRGSAGVANQVVKYSPIAVPTAPQAFAATLGPGSGDITLTWQAPASNGGSPIVGYKVYRGATSGSEALVTSGGCANLGNVLTCTESDYAPGVTRYYQVSAVSGAEGPRSAEDSATTGPPSSPQGLITSVGAGLGGHIRLGWVAPAINAESVTGYKVFRGATSGSETLLATLGRQQVYTDDGLGTGATRYYRVSALNAVGESAPSAEVSATTPATAAGPVTQVGGGGWDGGGDASSGCATLRTGYATCWALGSDGIPTLPRDLDKVGDVIHVAPQYEVACLLKGNGTVRCSYDGDMSWQGDFGPGPYLGGDAWALAATSEHACALLTSRNVHCWGYQGAGDYTGGDAVAVAYADGAACALRSNGNVECWGDAWRNLDDYAGGDATAIAMGYGHRCILTTSKNVHCWGVNTEGQAAPYNGGDAIAIAASDYQTCALKTNGNVDCWGDSGGAKDYTGGSAVALSTNNGGGCVLRADGAAVCWDLWGSYPSTVYVGRPSYPYPLTVTPGPGAGQLTLAWQPTQNDGGFATQGYKVYRGTSSSFATMSLLTSGGCANLGSGALTCTDSGLGNGVKWYYALSQVTEAGEGDDKIVRSATTFAPPGAPRNLAAAAGPGAGQITLAWQAPSSNGGSPVTSYQVHRGTTSGSEVLVTSGGCANLGNVLTCTDSGLGNGATRYYKVTATNVAGTSGYSNEASATTFVPPGAPTGLAATAGPGGGQLTLTWQAPSSNGGSPVTSYQVYRGATSGSEVLVTSGGCANLGNVLTCTDSGLGNGATRHYKVRASNVAGASGDSNEASATTAVPPSAPNSPSAVAGPGAGQIRLTWQAPSSTGGLPVTNYQVYRGTSSGALSPVPSGGCANLGNVLTCTDSGLGNGATRFYKVAAVNPAGAGAQSAEVSATTFVPPSAPQSLQATTDFVGGKVHLSWIAPASNGGAPVTGYRVYRTVGSGPETSTVIGNQLSWDDFTCPVGSTCHYQVVARNVAGDGVRSNQASALGTKV